MQTEHCSIAVRPDSAVVFPAGQDAQAASPLAVAPVIAYFPTTQAVMGPVQVSTAKPGEEPNDPTVQGVQVDPMVEYVPAGQSVHELIAVLPLTDVFPAEQLAHTVDRDESDEGEPSIAYFPAGQIFTVQVVVDGAVLYVPDGHLVQPLREPEA